MKIGLSSYSLAPAYWLSSFSISFLALFHTSITKSNLSLSVINPLWNCLLIFLTSLLDDSTIASLFLLVTISEYAIVIPEYVENLNP